MEDHVPKDIYALYERFPLYKFYVHKETRMPIRVYGTVRWKNGTLALNCVLAKPNGRSLVTYLPEFVEAVDQYDEFAMRILNQSQLFRPHFLLPSGFSHFLPR